MESPKPINPKLRPQRLHNKNLFLANPHCTHNLPLALHALPTQRCLDWRWWFPKATLTPGIKRCNLTDLNLVTLNFLKHAYHNRMLGICLLEHVLLAWFCMALFTIHAAIHLTV